MEENQMTVFISWSQPTSHAIAEVLKEYFTDLFDQKVTFWVSSVDISTGSIAFQNIVNALQQSSMAIVCIDSSNYTKPWIYFETGVVFGRNYSAGAPSSVLPIIFDSLQISDFESTPFSNMQLMYFTKATLKNALNQINDMYERKMGSPAISKKTFASFFDKFWPDIYGKIDSIIKQRGVGSNMRLSKLNVTELLEKHGGFPEPIIGDVIRYANGFETHKFYAFLLQNVTSRLYIFGRKNRKLSDASCQSYYSTLKSKAVDLKILFLNPNSQYAQQGTPQDIEDFRERLILSLKDFVTRYKRLGADISDDCRMYSVQRESEVIVADDIVFYKEVAYSSDGKPVHFTDSSFFIASIDSQLGKMYYDQFDSVWQQAANTKVTPSFVETLEVLE